MKIESENHQTEIETIKRNLATSEDVTTVYRNANTGLERLNQALEKNLEHLEKKWKAFRTLFLHDVPPAPSNPFWKKAGKNDASNKAATLPGLLSRSNILVPKKTSGATRPQLGSSGLFKPLFSVQPVPKGQETMLKREADSQNETPANKLRAIATNFDAMVARNATLKLDHELKYTRLVALRDQQKTELQSREHKAKNSSLQAENKALKEKVRKAKQVWDVFHGLGNILDENED
ncbi:uncharacterized protein N0V89_004245 [Didymosphaeria variabile]|uniref:Uncharacterized protein n=1 Tax=Didymosphaeria variabile TaxID=1932322 RepID=A0A9W9CD04_9PLEO|nr:uncharacterized protein N0V89_004245 [Didymosphaeria variabile]KAJ4356215.1 hypothetical protein N0V89_004245 [Didymosphaeria variabile]